MQGCTEGQWTNKHTDEKTAMPTECQTLCTLHTLDRTTEIPYLLPIAVYMSRWKILVFSSLLRDSN